MDIFFDLDGVLLDTEKPALELWKKYLPANKVMCLWEKCLGVSSKAEFGCFKSHLGWNKQAYKEFSEKISILPRVRSGAVEVLTVLSQQGHKLYLVTSSSKKSADKKLDYCDLGHFFRKVITADNVPRSKPYPDPYMLAKSLAGNSGHKVVIEDSPAGIFSAYNAGLEQIIFYEDTVKCPSFFENDMLKCVKGDFRQVLAVIKKVGK